ncbi:hypothetical protein BH24CHL5_BH24CHL5_00520 [soil metagenome]
MSGQMPGAPGMVIGALPGATPAGGAGMDERLGQIRGALQSSGSQAAATFSGSDQSNVTVEQLRAYLRQYGLQATATVDRRGEPQSAHGRMGPDLIRP